MTKYRRLPLRATSLYSSDRAVIFSVANLRGVGVHIMREWYKFSGVKWSTFHHR